MKQEDHKHVYYSINVEHGRVSFQKVQHEDLYNPNNEGFVRKAILNQNHHENMSDRFVDPEFSCQPPENCRMIRLYDFYKEEQPLFPQNGGQSSYINPQKEYNSFLAESGILSYDYLRTLFITQTVNHRGYYQYFIKRNGQYYLEECDDWIPIERTTWRPLWGLNKAYPWQIILFKAWLKQCGSFQKLHQAQGFSLLQSFGLPSYKLFNFRKQSKFVEKETVTENEKYEKKKNFTLNKTDTVIIGRTVGSQKMKKLGLVPNVAGYKIRLVNSDKQPHMYQVYSSLPCYWVGSHSAVVEDTPLNEIYNTSQYNLDLQRKVLMSSHQINTYFNKFYVVPDQYNEPQNLKIQDWFNINVNEQPVWLRFNAHQQGLLSISIEIPKQKNNHENHFPQLRYFLSKRNDETEVKKSRLRIDIDNQNQNDNDNMYGESNCDKWEYYRIDYVQGYTNHSAFYSRVLPAEYVLYINCDYSGPVRVRFDSHVKITQPELYYPSKKEYFEIFNSTFFSISREDALEATFNRQTYDESIALNNSFGQLGFGTICIKTLKRAKQKIAMRVFPNKLRGSGYQIVSISDHDIQEEGEGQIILQSENGNPKIMVLERTKQNRNKSQIKEEFPPAGCVEFFKFTPNNLDKSHLR